MIEYLPRICETLGRGNLPSNIVLTEADEEQTLNLKVSKLVKNKTKQKCNVKGVCVRASTIGELFYFETSEAENITKTGRSW